MLTAGEKIGIYEVVSSLGTGGMGEVYRARDTKLQRDVALKILPETMARDAQRMARFEREAQVLASLNHPNIAAIYGLEESNGIRALVMELVEGETLAERLRRVQPLTRPASRDALSPQAGRGEKPNDLTPSPQGRGWSSGAGSGEGSFGSSLTIDDALPIAKQIVEALEYAHERGVIHRDLKPANVKITPEGTVKVLDFGLAKVLDTHDSTATMDMANSPTISAMATQAGMILGTAAYMCPEQAKGQRVDRRADIWAFGCVLYEMLSGRKPFEGETISDVLASVIKSEPDWSAIPDTTPRTIQKLVRRCLIKDAKQRLRDIGEARIAIEETLSGSPALTGPLLPGEGGPEERDRVRVPSLRSALPWAVAAVLAIALIAVALAWKFTTPTTGSFPVLSYIPPPPNTTFRDFGFGRGPVVISLDGKQLAFSATDENGVTRLYVRPLGSDKATAIAGTKDAASPFWSPSDNSIGFFAGGKLKTVNLANGNVQILADASCPNSSGAWNSNGTILFMPACTGALKEVSSSGGNAKTAITVESGQAGQSDPEFLPDGQHFIFVSWSENGSESIWRASLDSGKQKLILKDASLPEFSSGYLLFVRNGRVFAQQMDPIAGRLTGETTALASALSFSVSTAGVLAFQGGTLEGHMEWYDRSGNALGSIGPVARYASVRISPDGKAILADVRDPQASSSDLWSYPASGGVGTRLTFSPGGKYFAVWSPDGRHIAYMCYQGRKVAVCRKPSNGSGVEETLFTLSAGMQGAVIDWSPDGRYLSTNEQILKSLIYENVIFPLFGDRKPFRPAPTSASQYDGLFSPDGHWLAYFSYESGRPEVYVVPFPGPGGKFQISQNGGWACHWDKKGRLYFLSMGNRLMEADLGFSGGAVQVKSLQPLFHVDLPGFANPFFDVSADGNRFIVVTSSDPNASRSIGLLLNWESKLKDK